MREKRVVEICREAWMSVGWVPHHPSSALPVLVFQFSNDIHTLANGACAASKHKRPVLTDKDIQTGRQTVREARRIAYLRCDFIGRFLLNCSKI